MAESSYPRDGHNSGALTAPEYDRVLAAYTPSGLVGTATDPPLVYGNSSGRRVLIRADRFGYVRGVLWSSGGTELEVPISANSLAQRYDLVVLRKDRSNGQVSLAVREGTNGGPVPAAVQQTSGDSGTWELPLASVRVIQNATTIQASDVTPLAWYLSDTGGVIVCTSTTRPPVSAGLQIHEVDTGRGFIGVAGAWRLVYEDTGWVDMVVPTGWTRSICRYRRKDGTVELLFSIRRDGAALAAGTDQVFFTLPANFRPAVETRVVGHIWLSSTSVAAALVRIYADGRIVLTDYTASFATAKFLYLPPVTYTPVLAL